MTTDMRGSADAGTGESTGGADAQFLEPVLVVAGGPLLDPAYLGDLGGLGAARELVRPVLPEVRAAEVVAALEDARDELGLDQVDVVAHSAGATALYCYLAQHPERVRRVVLVTPAVSAIGVTADQAGVGAVLDARSDDPTVGSAAAALREDPLSPEGQRVLFGRWGEEQERLARLSLVDRAERLATYYAEPRPDPDGLRAAARTYDGPVTVVHGEVDVHPTRRQADELAALFAAGEVVTVPGAGHYPWLDDPRGLAGAVLHGLGR